MEVPSTTGATPATPTVAVKRTPLLVLAYVAFVSLYGGAGA